MDHPTSCSCLRNTVELARWVYRTLHNNQEMAAGNAAMAPAARSDGRDEGDFATSDQPRVSRPFRRKSTAPF